MGFFFAITLYNAHLETIRSPNRFLKDVGIHAFSESVDRDIETEGKNPVTVLQQFLIRRHLTEEKKAYRNRLKNGQLEWWDVSLTQWLHKESKFNYLPVAFSATNFFRDYRNSMTADDFLSRGYSGFAEAVCESWSPDGLSDLLIPYTKRLTEALGYEPSRSVVLSLIFLHLFDETFEGGRLEVVKLNELQQTIPQFKWRFATRDEDLYLGVDIIGKPLKPLEPVHHLFEGFDVVGIQVKPASYLNSYMKHHSTQNHRHREHAKHILFLSTL